MFSDIDRPDHLEEISYLEEKIVENCDLAQVKEWEDYVQELFDGALTWDDLSDQQLVEGLVKCREFVSKNVPVKS
jgi:hypothetical protein